MDNLNWDKGQLRQSTIGCALLEAAAAVAGGQTHVVVSVVDRRFVRPRVVQVPHGRRVFEFSFTGKPAGIIQANKAKIQLITKH